MENNSEDKVYRIAYIELDTHAEIAFDFLELIKDSAMIKADYFFSEKILKTLGLKEGENIHQTSPENILQQLSLVDYDLVVIGTVHRYFNTFRKITKQHHTAIISHNLNFVTTSSFSLFKKIFKEDFQYRVKLLLKEGLLSKNETYQNARLLVLDENLTQYDIGKALHFLPVFYNKFTTFKSTNFRTIVIPGGVSQKRRDYKKVIDILEKTPVDQPMRVVFLGKAAGAELQWMKDLKAKKNRNLDIIFFEKKVKQDVFDHWMQEADLLWCPVQVETEFFSNREIYGSTKMSGNIGDAIKYGKQAVFPQEYQNQYSFITSDEREIFSGSETTEFDFSTTYNKENIRKKLESLLLSLILQKN